MTWQATRHYVCDVWRLLQSNYGDKSGQYVYMIAESTSPDVLYIGKTTRSIKARLLQHISSRSQIGRVIEPLYYRSEGNLSIQCAILIIQGDLSTAEKYCIQTKKPLLNIQYNSPTDISQKGQAQVFAPSSPLPAPRTIHIPTWSEIRVLQDAIAAQEQDRLYESLYSKAFRDPNHPDLRKETV